MCSVHSTFIVFFSLFCALENKAVPLGRRYAMPSHNNVSVPSTYCKIWKCNEQGEHGAGLVWLYQCEKRWCLGERNSRCPIQVKHSPRRSVSLCHIPQDCEVMGEAGRGVKQVVTAYLIAFGLIINVGEQDLRMRWNRCMKWPVVFWRTKFKWHVILSCKQNLCDTWYCHANKIYVTR